MDYLKKAADLANFTVKTREEVLTMPQLQCYAGTPHRSADELKEMHDAQDVALRNRISDFPGAYVIFSLDGDAEDFVLVGDDPQQLAREAYERECEIRGIAP